MIEEAPTMVTFLVLKELHLMMMVISILGIVATTGYRSIIIMVTI